jgi:hypothetical protein
VVVWEWLNSAPADNSNKKRRDLIMDRWIADSNIPSFTDRNSQSQIDTVTASVDQKKTLTLSVLSARLSMLSQLASEVSKMNRLFDELEMNLRGIKRVGTEVASEPNEVSLQNNSVEIPPASTGVTKGTTIMDRAVAQETKQEAF